MKASVIIINHDQLDLVGQCLHHLFANSQEIEKEVFVVDNASPHAKRLQDLCVEMGCHYVRNEQNLSFARCHNQVIPQATGEWILCLNDDTLPNHNKFISQLIKFAEDRPKLGVLGCKLLFPNEKIQHCGIVFNQYRQPHHYLLGSEHNDPWSEYPKQYQAVTGGCMLFKKELFIELGGFKEPSERFEYHYEDVDFCLKARRAGYEVWYTPEVSIIHYSGMTAKTKIPQAKVYEHLPKLQEEWFIDIEHDDWILDLPEDKPKIAIGICLADGCRWRFKQQMRMVEQLDYFKKNVYIIFGTSNCSQEFFDEISTWGTLNVGKYADVLMPSHTEYKDGKMASVYHNRNSIRDIFLKTPAKYLFFLDADVAIEKRTLKRLVSLAEENKVDVTAGTYFYKIEENTKPMLFSTRVKADDFRKKNLKDQVDLSSYKKDRVIGLGNFRLARDLMDGGVHEAGAAPMGCTLISRKALEQIPFEPKVCYGTEDLSWFAEAQAKGFKLLVDTGLKNFHLDANGMVYCWWNLPLEDDEYRYEVKPVKEKICIQTEQQ
jgi:GT2 family glycosyltransferase